MEEVKEVASKTTETKYGAMRFTAFSNGLILLMDFRDSGQICRFFTREEAMKLSENISDVIAEYDAGRDDYIGDE